MARSKSSGQPEERNCILSINDVSQVTQLNPPDGWKLLVRTSSMENSGVYRKGLGEMGRGRKALTASRSCQLFVLMTAGLEATVAALTRNAADLHIWDPLVPSNPIYSAAAKVTWSRNGHYWVIRRGDADTLLRYGVRHQQIEFLHFPVTSPSVVGRDDGYIYSAGTAHRDWTTLLDALILSNARARLAAKIADPQVANIDVLGHISPARGRDVLRDCAIVAMPFEDTDKPVGPLVILDALAAGKPVVATNVNGARDYVVHGETGLLVPPKDSRAMASAISQLMADARLRHHMGANSRALADKLSLKNQLRQIAAANGSGS